MGVISCGPGGRALPTPEEHVVIDAFTEYLLGNISMDEMDRRCATMDGENATQEGTTHALGTRDGE